MVKYTEVKPLKTPSKTPPVKNNYMFPSWDQVKMRRKQRNEKLVSMKMLCVIFIVNLSDYGISKSLSLWFNCNEVYICTLKGITIVCKPSVICVQENFARFTPMLSQLFLTTNQSSIRCLCYIIFQIIYILVAKISFCAPVYLL